MGIDNQTQEFSFDEERDISSGTRLEDEELSNEEKPETLEREPQKKKKKKRKKHHFLTTLIAVVLIVGSSIFLSYMILAGVNDLYAISKSSTVAVINIPTGATASTVAKQLKDAGIIDQKWLFQLVMKMRGDGHQFQAGVHTLSAEMDYETIIEELKTPAAATENIIHLTFKEGTTLDEMSAMLEENNVCAADEFLEAVNQNTYQKKFETYLTGEDESQKYYRREGYAFPDSYDFFQEEKVDSVVNKLFSAFDERMESSGLYQEIEQSEYSLDEVITLASIIQAEGRTVEDMQKISSVLHNRLNNKGDYPKLESDPTKNYAHTVLLHMDDAGMSDSEAFSRRYDTYESIGLPPGAICNPGIDAIRAVLHPANTNYYYFCANLDTGECFYAETLEEHNENLKKVGLQ